MMGANAAGDSVDTTSTATAGNIPKACGTWHNIGPTSMALRTVADVRCHQDCAGSGQDNKSANIDAGN